MKKATAATLLASCLLVLTPLTMTAYKAYAGEPGYNVSCSEHPNGASACNTNGCFLCSSGTWTAQPFYIGATATSCSSSYTGMMRYNSGSLEYCNGSAWTALAAGSTTNVYMGSNEPYLRFSSTTAAYSATNSTKDSTCTTDFGSDFQAAQLQDVTIYIHGGIGTYTNFNVAGNTSNSYAPIESGSGGVYIYQYGSGTYPVACVRKDAPVLFSRTTVAYSASDSTKNSTCSTDFGSNYEAGSALDLAANIKAFPYDGSYNVRGNASYSFYAGSSNGGIWLNTTSGGTLPVICMRKAPSSSSVSVCSTITHSSTLYTSSGSTTWTPPSSASESCPVTVRVLVVGGGGGGGAGSNYASGGGSGYVYSQQLSITSSAALTVTVGSGGSGGTSGNNNGTAGNSSVFGTITVGGGLGGSKSGTGKAGGSGSGVAAANAGTAAGGTNGNDGGSVQDSTYYGISPGGAGQRTPFVSESSNTRDAAGLIFQSATFAAGSAGATASQVAGSGGGILINNAGSGGAAGSGGTANGGASTGYGGGGGGTRGGTGTGGTGGTGVVYIEW